MNRWSRTDGQRSLTASISWFNSKFLEIHINFFIVIRYNLIEIFLTKRICCILEILFGKNQILLEKEPIGNNAVMVTVIVRNKLIKLWIFYVSWLIKMRARSKAEILTYLCKYCWYRLCRNGFLIIHIWYKIFFSIWKMVPTVGFIIIVY